MFSTRSVVVITMFTLMLCTNALAHHPTAETSIGLTGPIRTLSPTPLDKGSLNFSLQFEFIDFDAFSDEELRQFAAAGNDVHGTDSITHTILGVNFGLTDNLTLSLSLPYVYVNNIKEAHEDEPEEVHEHGDAEGIGDLTLLSQYRFLQAGGYESSMFLGLKIPSGRTDDTDLEGVRFETEFQAGTGSWDPIAGLAARKELGKVSVTAGFLYSFATGGAQDTDLGDYLDYGAALSYRAFNGKMRWDLIMEANGKWQQRQEIGGVEDPNSGGNIIYLSPGTRLCWKRLSLYLSLGFPVLQDLNGVQTDVGFRILSGIGFEF
jgi:hypothetical protein